MRCPDFVSTLATGIVLERLAQEDISVCFVPLCVCLVWFWQVVGYEKADQPWYICQECDSEWKVKRHVHRKSIWCKNEIVERVTFLRATFCM